MGRGSYRGWSRCPKWFRDHRWNNRERVRERDTFREDVKQYRGEATVENGWQNFHHKHGAQWDWS